MSQYTILFVLVSTKEVGIPVSGRGGRSRTARTDPTVRSRRLSFAVVGADPPPELGLEHVRDRGFVAVPGLDLDRPRDDVGLGELVLQPLLQLVRMPRHNLAVRKPHPHYRNR